MNQIRQNATSRAAERDTVPWPRPERLALFLDLDGTLAPIAPHPAAVGPTPDRTALLRRLHGHLQGRIAILSGRALSEIDRICGGVRLPAAGVHGLQRRDACGHVIETFPAPGLKLVTAVLEAYAALHPGVLVEVKPGALALHVRQAPARAEEAAAMTAELAKAYGLELQAGDQVFELKTPGANKGAALAAFMAEAPFEGGVPVMIGDDLTDEHAFEAAQRLGGFGVLVGDRQPSAARHGLADVDAVMTALAGLADRLERV